MLALDLARPDGLLYILPDLDSKSQKEPAAVAQWPRRRAAETKDAGSILAAAAAFQMGAEAKISLRRC